MKIAHVLPLLTKGGAEKVVVDLANQAIADGHEVTIIVAYPVDFKLLPEALHLKIRILDVSGLRCSKWGMYFNILPWLWQKRDWLEEQDILHCHLTYGTVFGVLVCFFRKLLGLSRTTVVETYHSVGMNVAVFLRWVHAKLLERFDAVAFMAQDDYWRAFIKRRPKLLAKIIPNGISFQKLITPDSVSRNKYRRAMGIPDKCRYVVGTVGRLRQDRKPWLYIPIFAQMAKVFGQDIHFIIAGDGPEYNHVKLLAAEYGLQEQLHLPGLIMEPQQPMSIMDLYFTLNVGALTGIAAMEAASLGVAVLAIQMLSDYKTQGQDWIWSDTDLSKISARAIELLRSQPDRQALALRQSAYVRSHHSIESMARSYEILYKAALERIKLV